MLTQKSYNLLGEVIFYKKTCCKKKSLKKSFPWKIQNDHKMPIYGWIIC
jgi:hypothetical protein